MFLTRKLRKRQANNGGANFAQSLKDAAPFIAQLTTSTTLNNGSSTPTYSRATVASVFAYAAAAVAGDSPLLISCASGEARFTGARRVSQGVFSDFLSDGTPIADSVLKGILIEAAGTQLVTPTASIRDMTDATWAKVTMTTAKTATGIDGTANSATTCTATGATSTILQTLVAAGSSRTYSCYIKRRTGTGTVTIKQGATTLDVTASINSSTYSRVELNANILNSSFGIILATSGDAVDVDCNQFEAGAFATSPMLAAGAVRNADILTYATAGNFSDTAGTMTAEATQTSWANAAGSIIGSATQGMMPLSTNNGVKGFDGTNTVNGTAGAPSGTIKMAVSWTGVVMTVKGGVSAAVGGTYDGAWNLASIGIGTSGYGNIKNVRIWPRALSASELIGITQ